MKTMIISAAGTEEFELITEHPQNQKFEGDFAYQLTNYSLLSPNNANPVAKIRDFWPNNIL
jgi:hypothetical protein